MTLLFKYLLFLPLFSPVFLSPTAEGKHPFYVSVTEINHNAQEKTLEISCKFFTDDFEQTIEKANKISLDITTAKDKPNFDKLIPDYIGKHLSVAVGGKAVKLNYIGFEVEKESVYCYFEAPNVPSVKKIDIFNTLLHDFTPEQINIIHVTVNGARQSTKLNVPQSMVSIAF